MKTTRSRETLTLWDGEVLPLLSHAEIVALPSDDRSRYEEKLRGYDNDNENRTRFFKDWVAYRDRCAYDGCTRQKYEHFKHCVTHVSVDDVEDPSSQVNRRATQAKLRMAELLEKAVDELEKMVDAPDGEIPAAIRLKAIDTVFDRAHLPRQTAQSVQMDGDLTVTHVDAGALIQERLDRLAGSFITGELDGIESATAESDDITD